MNIIEAIKSGNRYRRIGDTEWRKAAAYDDNTGAYYQYIDLVAGDWEVEDPTVRISRGEFYRAYEKATAEAKETGFHPADVLAKWLGL